MTAPRAALARVLAAALAVSLAACVDPYTGRPYYQTLDETVARNLARGDTISYTVEQGDTLYRLARAFSVAPKAIIEANDLNAPYHLQRGQNLEIPRPRAHTVKDGDTLYRIAQRYNVGQAELRRLNDLDDATALQPGRKLRLPWTDRERRAGGGGERQRRSGAPQTAQAPVPDQKPGDPPPPSATREPTNGQRNGTATASGESGQTTRQSASPDPKVSFVRPVAGEVIAGYGAQGNDQHNDGLNIAAQQGTPVRAAGEGTVAYADNDLEAFGNLVLLRHDGNWVTAYAHLAVIEVERGQEVAQNDRLGTVGRTGKAQRPQLHFEIRRGTEAVDPRPYLQEPQRDEVAVRNAPP